MLINIGRSYVDIMPEFNDDPFDDAVLPVCAQEDFDEIGKLTNGDESDCYVIPIGSLLIHFQCTENGHCFLSISCNLAYQCYCYYNFNDLMRLLQGNLDLRTLFEHAHWTTYSAGIEYELTNKQAVIDAIMESLHGPEVYEI